MPNPVGEKYGEDFAKFCGLLRIYMNFTVFYYIFKDNFTDFREAKSREYSKLISFLGNKKKSNLNQNVRRDQ